MAGTWAVDVEVIDLPQRTIRVQGTRTDGEDVRTYCVEGKYDRVNFTPHQLLTVYTGWLWDQYQADLVKETQIAALLGQAETALANALNAQEVG